MNCAALAILCIMFVEVRGIWTFIFPLEAWGYPFCNNSMHGNHGMKQGPSNTTFITKKTVRKVGSWQWVKVLHLMIAFNVFCATQQKTTDFLLSIKYIFVRLHCLSLQSWRLAPCLRVHGCWSLMQRNKECAKQNVTTGSRDAVSSPSYIVYDLTDLTSYTIITYLWFLAKIILKAPHPLSPFIILKFLQTDV